MRKWLFGGFEKRRGEKGQAVIEMSMSLPFLIWLIYYTIKAFHMLHTASIAQRYAAMSLWERVDNRAKFVIDDVDNNGQGRLHGREFMAVRYMDVGSNQGGFPMRGILDSNEMIISVIGVCREPGCTQ